MTVAAAAIWLGVRSPDGPATTGVVTIEPSSVVAAAPSPPPALPPPPATLLEAPKPPPVADAIAAEPDAFVGTWRAPGDARLVIARVADRYDVKLTINGSLDAYDGVLRDGRVQIARGIDGDWIQALTGSGIPCLQLGTTQKFCRA